MQYLEIILNLPVNQGFTYSYIPPENEKAELIPAIGKRAEIMFGNKKTQGFIINISDKLPENCRKYIEFIEEQIGFPITMVSNGPKREDIIIRNK